MRKKTKENKKVKSILDKEKEKNGNKEHRFWERRRKCAKCNGWII